MKDAVQQIKERLPIADCISSYINLEQSGANYKAKCPFHNEKTPSFFVSVERNSYYCFGCAAKGDIFSFVENFEGLDFRGALKVLADRTGVKLDDYRSQTADDKVVLYKILEEASLFFEANFAKNNEARAYLVSRGLNDKSIKDFRIGFAPDSWRSLKDHLIKNGYKESDIEKVGLIKSGDKGSYDRFRSRIMFPIMDTSGRVIAFSGRLFGDNQDTSINAKYLNSPETELFSKSNVLFGIDKAKSAIRTKGYTILVEGQMDLVMSHQAGFTNTVAVSGTAFVGDTSNDENAISNFGLVYRLSRNIILAFDGDNAGVKAAHRSAKIALSVGMQTNVAKLEEGLDPADIIKKSGEEWKEIIKNSKNAIHFFTERICNKESDIRKRANIIREFVFPLLTAVSSEMERSAYIKQIHDISGISQESIIKDFQNFHKSDTTITADPNESKHIRTISRKELMERRLSGIIFKLAGIGIDTKIAEDVLIPKDFMESLEARYDPFKDEVLAEIDDIYSNDSDKMLRDRDEIVMNIEQDFLEDERLKIKGNDIESLKKLQEINRRIEAIKSSRIKQ